MARFYDQAGAARYLKVTPSAVAKHISEGNIKTTYQAHLGSAGKIMIAEVDLLTFIWSDHYTKSRAGLAGYPGYPDAGEVEVE